MASTPYFGTDFFAFLRELGRHNDRAWFTANKARYESSVQTPAVRFVAEVGPKLASLSRHVGFDARRFGGSISRIYRDTRFSKDKSPYKTHVGIHFAHERAMNSEEHLPGFYLHLDPGESFVASGIWRPELGALSRIRSAIARTDSAWSRVLRSGIRIEGESYVRVPAGFDPNHQFAQDLKRKDFFASMSFRDSQVTSREFARKFLGACRRINPLNAFLAQAIGVPW